MRPHRCAVLLVLLCAVVLADNGQVAKRVKPGRATVPVTTHSPKARQLFEQGMVNFEYLRTQQALEDWRAAAKADPNFASAHILVAFLTNDPAEEKAARAQAKKLAPQVSPGEQLLIRWLTGVREAEYVPAIAAMNDLLASYPRDTRMAFLAGRWLILQGSYAQGEKLLQRAIAMDPDYPAAINELGYAYALSGDFNQAFQMMERYVALQPEQPNPQDSYAEILRLAGKFDAALEHYRAALKIDPKFVSSQLGIGDTYALMGEEQKARDEYAAAIANAESEGDRLAYKSQLAITYVREKNWAAADQEFRAVANEAHKFGLGNLEAQAYRMMAMYHSDQAAALYYLEQGERALKESHDIAKSEREEEQARILCWRAIRATRPGGQGLAGKALQQLSAMAAASRRDVIQRSYHAAQGAVLVAGEKYAEAVPHLEEVSDDALSMQLLWRAYTHTGAQKEADALRARLADLNRPTIDQALVVPDFRATVGHPGR